MIEAPPAFDETKHRLGTLCKAGHEHGSTGMSLRYISSPSCVQCAIGFARANTARLREEREALWPPGLKPCPACETLIAREHWRCGPCARQWRQDWTEKNADTLRTQQAANRARRRVEDWHIILWRNTRSSSKTRNLVHSISADDLLGLWEAQQGRCHWTQIEMLIDCDLRHPQRVSIDRINPAGGYVEGNCVLSTMFVNLGRSNNSEAVTREFLIKFAEALR